MKPERKEPLYHPAMYDWNEIVEYYNSSHPDEDLMDSWNLITDRVFVRRESPAYIERASLQDLSDWTQSRIDWLFDNFADEDDPHCVTAWMDW